MLGQQSKRASLLRTTHWYAIDPGPSGGRVHGSRHHIPARRVRTTGALEDTSTHSQAGAAPPGASINFLHGVVSVAGSFILIRAKGKFTRQNVTLKN